MLRLIIYSSCIAAQYMIYIALLNLSLSLYAMYTLLVYYWYCYQRCLVACCLGIFSSAIIPVYLSMSRGRLRFIQYVPAQ